ncbi:cupredoxin domain-containing protein [Natronococcus occultus]|uniref:Copper binding protein, plastocyanin/azurin family n=1 Tax=Natronococcus occultus SP4 TaxID=694430 RepID=L0JVX1_9EURY|nr:hypothetical protein [Natronococcus occultus]AGB36013.1 hypothetical protein Natoc_0133 [Natronococcus occultus SP4]
MSPRADDATRRRFLSRTALALGGVFVAGCTGREDDADQESEPVVDEAETLETDTDPDAWVDVDAIRLDAYVGGWVGAEPAHVDRVENPTLVLFEGRSYEITIENRDNVKHNLAIWNAADERVGEYATDVVADTGATETLAFTATDGMATYICEHQPRIQLGDLEIVADE